MYNSMCCIFTQFYMNLFTIKLPILIAKSLTQVLTFSIDQYGLRQMGLVLRKTVFGFPTRSDTNQAAQQKKMDRDLKFWVKDTERMY